MSPYTAQAETGAYRERVSLHLCPPSLSGSTLEPWHQAYMGHMRGGEEKHCTCLLPRSLLALLSIERAFFEEQSTIEDKESLKLLKEQQLWLQPWLNCISYHPDSYH